MTGQSWQLLSTTPDLSGHLGLCGHFECASRNVNKKWSCGVPALPRIIQIRAASWVLAHQGTFSFWPPVKSSFGAICSAEHQTSTAVLHCWKNRLHFLPEPAHHGPPVCDGRGLKSQFSVQSYFPLCTFSQTDGHFFFFLENCSLKLNMKQISCTDNFSFLGKTGTVQVSAIYYQKSYQRWQIVGICPSPT